MIERVSILVFDNWNLTETRVYGSLQVPVDSTKFYGRGTTPSLEEMNKTSRHILPYQVPTSENL
jgi:hypothetical protein